MVIVNSQTPIPSRKRLLGKTPVYVAQYTRRYREGIKRERVRITTLGCVIGTGISVAVIVLSEFHEVVLAIVEPQPFSCGLEVYEGFATVPKR